MMPNKKEKKTKKSKKAVTKSIEGEDNDSKERIAEEHPQRFELKETVSISGSEGDRSSLQGSREASDSSIFTKNQPKDEEVIERETSFGKDEVVELGAEANSPEPEARQEADQQPSSPEGKIEDSQGGPVDVALLKETTIKEALTFKVETKMQVTIEGVVTEETSSDVLPGQIEVHQQQKVEDDSTVEIASNRPKEPSDSPLLDTIKKSSKEDASKDTQRRNLLPAGAENMEQDAEEVSPPGNKDTSNQGFPTEIQDEKAKRRNLDPDGKPEDAEFDSLHVIKEEDENENEVDVSTIVNENAVLEHEVPAASANVNQLQSEDSSEGEEELPWAMYRDIKKDDRASDAEDEFSEDEEIPEPPEEQNYPELYEYLGSLDNGDTELESKHIPPPLFENDSQKHMHKDINHTKLGLAEEEIEDYLDEFERQVEEEVLMIGNIGLGEVQDEERSIREEHIEFQKAETMKQKEKKQELSAAMDRAKKHVMKVFRGKYGRVKDKEAALLRRDRHIQGQITKAFRRSENQLHKALRKRKAEVMAMYGDLVFADREFGGGKGKRWKVDWNKTQQPIQIKLKCLRSVRDKMPCGEYVLMVSLFSRLGGHVMKWSNLRGQQWGAATLPLFHDGEYYNIELKIDQSVFTVCPSKPDIRPGMILMFELFILSGSFTPTDKVVAWGSFPICDGSFNVVEGKYKTPLMRGTIDPSIDKFQTVEEMMAFDLEHWLCNLYFEINKLPRYLMGQKEYEVELQFTSGLVSYPIRTKTGEEFVDGEQPVYGSVSDMASIAASRVSLPNSRVNSFLSLQEKNPDAKPGMSHIKVTVDPPNKKLSRPGSAISMLQKANEISTELRQRRTSRSSVNFQQQDDVVSRKLSAFGSRRSVGERSMAYSDESDTGSGTDYNDDDVCIVKKDYGFRKVKDQPGMYYKVHQNNPVDLYNRKLLRAIPMTAQPSARRKKKKVTHQDDLKQHTYNVKSIWSNKGHMPRKGREKMQYISRMMLAELGLSQWRKGQFWITLFMLIVTWFMRMYLHYFGQWVLLKSLSIPINKYNFYPHTVNLNYQDTLLQARHEIGVVIVGPFANLFLFLLFIPVTMLFQKMFKWFPDIITHFILAFGIQAFLDPLWILVVDCILGRYQSTGGVEQIGDAFKLYWHFYRNYRNYDVTLYVSISMTTFLYVCIAFCIAALWYMFFIRLHNNGRLMDVYWRLHGNEDEFFLPYDLEVSNEELNFICLKAEQWRGEEGERKKVAVYDYVWEQEELVDEFWDDPNAHGEKTGARETTTHVSIHSIHTDGLIELYRQFLRLPDGAIIEVFGEMNMPGIDEGVKQALLKGSGFKGVSNTVKRSRSLSVSSMGSSSGRKTSLRRMSSNRLDVPV